MNKNKLTLNPMVILLLVISISALLTYIIPAGSFGTVVKDGKTMLDPTVFNYLPAAHASLYDVLHAVVFGQVKAANLVIGTLFIGGTTSVLIYTGVLDSALSIMIKRLENKQADLILLAVFVFFSVMGGFLGSISITLAFIPLTVMVSSRLGYENIVGVSIPVLGGFSGFMAGPANPLTTGICQSIAGLPLFSGLALRMGVYFVSIVIVYGYIINYAHKTKNVGTIEKEHKADEINFGLKQIATLVIFFGGLGFFIYKALTAKWDYIDMCTVFLGSTMLIALVNKMSAEDYINSFLDGAKGLLSGALLIGLAQGIEIIITDGQILDTMVYGLSQLIYGLPSFMVVIVLFLIITVINFFIPSASGKAALMMPLLVPMAQISGFGLQTAVLAYQLGDGITKMIYPTVGTILAAISLGNVSYNKWFKFVLPLVLLLSALSLLLLVFAQKIGY